MLALVPVLIAAAHPSLFFGASDVPALRQAAQTTHATIASHITTILDQHLGDPLPTQSDYDDVRFLGNQVAVWAFGYQITGKTAYASKAREQLLTYAGWSSWDFGETADLGGPDLFTAHMLLGASAAYDWIYETLSGADRATIAAKIGVEAQKVATYLPKAWWIDEYLQNHNWIDTAGLGMAALALSGEDSRAAGWLALAEDDLGKLQASIGQIPDGSWHEGLPYEGYGLSMALPFWQAMRHAGRDYTDMGVLRGYGRFFLYAGTADAPQQVIVPFGDFTHWPARWCWRSRASSPRASARDSPRPRRSGTPRRSSAEPSCRRCGTTSSSSSSTIRRSRRAIRRRSPSTARSRISAPRRCTPPGTPATSRSGSRPACSGDGRTSTASRPTAIPAAGSTGATITTTT